MSVLVFCRTGRMRLVVTILTLLSALSLLANEIKLIKPYDKDIYMDGFASIVIDLGKSDASKIVVKVNEEKSVRKIPEKKEFYCTSVKLQDGVNSIQILLYDKNEKEIFKEARDLFKGSVTDKKLKYYKKYYKKRFFHTDKNEKVCMRCHDMSMNEKKSVAFENIMDSNCFSCHYKVATDRYLHAPVANWLCATVCHTGQSGRLNRRDGGKSKYLSPDPIANRCLGCHDKFQKKLAESRYKHEPVDIGRCNRCHDPHGSEIDSSFLREEVWNLCVSCHADKKSGSHVARTFSGKPHPTKGVKDPMSKEGKELSCISCHDPHMSNNGFMLKGDMGRGRALWCQRCHKK